MTTTGSRLYPDKAADARGGHLHGMHCRLMDLTADMVRALATDKPLFKRLYKWLAHEIMEWGPEYELHLVGAWSDLASRTLRARSPRHLARVHRREEPFRGIELDYFSHYERNVIPRWESDADEGKVVRVIPGSEWMTVAWGVQIKAHPTNPEIIIVRSAKQ